MIDLNAATRLMATHARLLDRRRLDTLLDDAPPESLLTTLAAYRNPHRGYGWALEPDLRSPTSQPAGALHAFEVLAEVAPATSPLAAPAVRLARDGGLPFALAGADSPGTAPWWASDDPTTSSLHITSAVCAYAHRLNDPTVKQHPWLQRATAPPAPGRLSSL